MNEARSQATPQQAGPVSTVFFDIWNQTPPGGQNIPQWVLERTRRIKQEPESVTSDSVDRHSVFTAHDVLCIINKESDIFRFRRGVPLRRAVAIFGADSVEYAMKRGSYLGETYCGCDIGGGRIVYFLTSYGTRLAATHSNHIFFSTSTDRRHKKT